MSGYASFDRLELELIMDGERLLPRKPSIRRSRKPQTCRKCHKKHYWFRPCDYDHQPEK